MESYYQVKRLTDRRIRIYDPLGVFMDLFIGQKKALLWDTGYGIVPVMGIIRELTSLPLIVVNSHGHIDHAVGNYQFDGPIYIHEKDIPVCQMHYTVKWKTNALHYAEEALDFFTGEPVKAITAHFDREAYLHQNTGHLVPVREGEVFDLGGMELVVVELPGHTPGSIGLLLREEGLLYAADAANNNVWLFLPEALCLSQYRQTLDKIWGLDFDQMIISHFLEPLDKAVILDYMKMADTLDYQKGIYFRAPLAPEVEARLCVLDGFSPDDMMAPGFASVVIREEKLQ